jgi:hypothetical protein
VLPQSEFGVGLNSGEAPSGATLRGVARKADVFRGGVLGARGFSDTGDEGERGDEIDTSDANTGKESERALCGHDVIFSLTGSYPDGPKMFLSSEGSSILACTQCR